VVVEASLSNLLGGQIGREEGAVQIAYGQISLEVNRK